MGRLSNLESTAKARLKYTGDVKIESGPNSDLEVEGLGTNPAVASSSKDLAQHSIKYAQNVRVEDHAFFHEFCRVKLNEIGFKKAEELVDKKIADCRSSDSEIAQLRTARALVAETLTDSILYQFFRQESEGWRNQLDYSFLMIGNLRTADRTYGLQALAQAAAYRSAKKRAGFGDDGTFGYAIREAFGQGDDVKYYDAMFAAMSGLPVIGGDGVIQQLDDTEIEAIVDCVFRLSEISTGKKSP